jgi:WD40 repeat protein
MIAGNPDGSISTWDTTTGRQTHKFAGHGEAIRCMAITPDGRTLVTGSADTTILVWDLAGW